MSLRYIVETPKIRTPWQEAAEDGQEAAEEENKKKRKEKKEDRMMSTGESIEIGGLY